MERRATDGDGRLVRVFLTSTGRERGLAVDGIWEALETEIVDGLDNKERKRLRKLLRKVEKNLAARLGADHGADDEPEGAEEDEESEEGESEDEEEEETR